LSDLSELSKIEYRGRDLDTALPPLLGCDALPAVGAGWDNGRVTVYRLTPDEVLLCGAPAGQVAALQSGFHGCLHALDRTCGFAHFLLAGPRAKEVLQHVTDLDVRDSACPQLCCRRGPLADVGVLLIRRDRRAGLTFETVFAFEIVVTRDYGEYVWDVLWETGRPLGMSIFGREARLRMEA
jgi:heterotetrameric sarcosine oxidase gamma subunit